MPDVFWVKGEKPQTDVYRVFNELVGDFKQKASLLDAIFLHIHHTPILKERFIQAKVFTAEYSNIYI
ncbi:MAG TPA: hypothetical protein PLW93_00750 [Candidatus Absconditabacterales bacterium]|nr:hypothetical protein [Candidatus Absconditabacterales bacterium]